MDDFSVASLTESQNEWCARLVHILTPMIIDGFRSIFDEAYKLCKDNDELDKYLMTFQNFIGRVPKWNPSMIEEEKKRIIERSGCGYLEELVTCVHIIKLKALACVRVGQKQKKIDVNVPSLNEFIHKIYINCARKIYTNVYLFEKNVPPLQIQKNNRELEMLIKECILITIRDSIPVESLLKAYMDETQETDTIVEEHVEEIEEEIPQLEPHVEEQVSASTHNESENERIKFNPIDTTHHLNGNKEDVEASKDIDVLERKSNEYFARRKQQEEEEEDEEKLQIGGDVDLEQLGLFDLESGLEQRNSEPLIDVEIL
jgi:hypothetical protein